MELLKLLNQLKEIEKEGLEIPALISIKKEKEQIDLHLKIMLPIEI